MKTFKGSKKRTAEDRSSLRKAVAEIIERVTEEGDKALRDYNRTFDGMRKRKPQDNGRRDQKSLRQGGFIRD